MRKEITKTLTLKLPPSVVDILLDSVGFNSESIGDDRKEELLEHVLPVIFWRGTITAAEWVCKDGGNPWLFDKTTR